MRLSRVGILLLIALAVWSAAVPFEFACSKESGFVMDPNAHQRVGFVSDFSGLGLTLQKDLQVSLPFKPTYPQLATVPAVNGGPTTAKVVGVIEQFSWSGGVNDPVTIQFYVSQENAAQLKALTNSTLKSSSVQAIGWWIGDYDQEAKSWFEEAKPSSSPTLKAMIQGNPAQPTLNVDLTPVAAKDGIDVNVYKASIKIVPQAHQVSTLSFANSSVKSVTKTWGLP